MVIQTTKQTAVKPLAFMLALLLCSITGQVLRTLRLVVNTIYLPASLKSSLNASLAAGLFVRQSNQFFYFKTISK